MKILLKKDYKQHNETCRQENKDPFVKNKLFNEIQREIFKNKQNINNDYNNNQNNLNIHQNICDNNKDYSTKNDKKPPEIAKKNDFYHNNTNKNLTTTANNSKKLSNPFIPASKNLENTTKSIKKPEVLNKKDNFIDQKTQKELDELIALNYYKEEMGAHLKKDEQTAHKLFDEHQEKLSLSAIKSLKYKEIEEMTAVDEYLAKEIKGF